MKTRSHRLIVPVILTLAAAGFVSAGAWSAAAQDMDSDSGDNARHFYWGGNLGISILQPMVVRSLPVGFITPGEVIAFNVGPRVDLSLGYNITHNFAVELQTGFAYNGLSSLDGISLDGLDADVWTVPFMANGIYKHSFNDHWQAYGGLGAGVLISTFDQWSLFESVSTTDCTFGYQAMLGIKYRFNDRWETGLGYNFTGSLDHHWNDDGVGITTSPTYQHSIILSLTRRF
jgi:opacity protein-like surface antigen